MHTPPSTRNGSDHDDRHRGVRSSLDVEAISAKSIGIVGGAYGLALDLARHQLRRVVYCDFDHVEPSNVTRQDFAQSETTQLKAEVIAHRIEDINPHCNVHPLTRDVMHLSDTEEALLYDNADLIIIATDSFRANATVNAEAMRRGIPVLHVSLYAGGGAGEVIYWIPGVTPACYRCIASERYQYFENQEESTTPSDGATIFDLRAIDAVAGHIALGVLTAGADNRYGRLIESLGNRNLIQVRNDPEWLLGGRRDIFKAHLGESPANFSFTSICQPMEQEPDCPDCALFRKCNA